jgi:hypothetical protein
MNKGFLMVKSDQTSSANKSDDIPAQALSIVVKDEMIPFFFQLLGHGFSMNVQTGCSVKDLLCLQFGISEDYLEERIKTIFLNAKVVDDVSTANITEGSTLALSGAMPGLVGAILRSGGFYASMRSQISFDQNKPSSLPRAGKITLKLLNLVVKELGPAFLEKGIWFNGGKLQEFMKHHLEELKTGGAANELNGEPVEINNLLELDWNDKTVFLQVRSEKAL